MNNKCEYKYKVLTAFDKLNACLDTFNFEWEIDVNEKFTEITNKFILEHGEINKDVFYILESEMDSNIVRSMKVGSMINFTNETTLEKREDFFLYHNSKPIVFGIHIHLEHNEEITPLLSDVIMYYLEGNSYSRIKVSVGETYITPKGVKHAALFSKPNTIKIKWH